MGVTASSFKCALFLESSIQVLDVIVAGVYFNSDLMGID